MSNDTRITHTVVPATIVAGFARHKSRMCIVCGTSFTTTRHDASYCSGPCRQKAIATAANPSAGSPAT
jgi:hypothetical protein